MCGRTLSAAAFHRTRPDPLPTFSRATAPKHFPKGRVEFAAESSASESTGWRVKGAVYLRSRTAYSC